MNDIVDNSTPTLEPAPIETPDNPLLRINPDLKDCALAKAASAAPFGALQITLNLAASAALMLAPAGGMGALRPRFGSVLEIEKAFTDTQQPAPTTEEIINCLIELARSGQKEEFEKIYKLLSPAKRLLFDVHIKTSGKVEQIDIGDYTFFAKPLEWADLTAVWQQTPHSADGFVDWKNKAGVRRMTVEILTRSLVTSQEDKTPLFDEDAAGLFADMPGAAELIEPLFAELDELNPTLFPKASAAVDAGADSEHDDISQ